MADQGKIMITMAIPASTARALAISGAGTLSASLRAIGVVHSGTDADQTSGPVQIGGTALCTAGEAITAGQLVVSDAAGKMIAVSVGSEHLAMAIALEAAAADGVLFDAKLI